VSLKQQIAINICTYYKYFILFKEKTGDSKNAKFAHDFKTLADVLIQETVRQENCILKSEFIITFRHDLGLKYPNLKAHIFGEESNTFTNANGEKIVVEVKENQGATAELLEKVLDGNKVR